MDDNSKIMVTMKREGLNPSVLENTGMQPVKEIAPYTEQWSKERGREYKLCHSALLDSFVHCFRQIKMLPPPLNPTPF